MQNIKSILLGLVLSVATLTLKADDNWILTLSGSGTSGLQSKNDLPSGITDTALGVNVGIGRTGKLLLPIEGGARQGFSWASENDAKIFDTQLYFDAFPVKFKRFELGAGVNVGATYGNTPIVYSAGPEAVARIWIKDDVGIQGRVSYPFDLGNQKLGDRLIYTLSLIVRF